LNKSLAIEISRRAMLSVAAMMKLSASRNDMSRRSVETASEVIAKLEDEIQHLKRENELLALISRPRDYEH
jgi:hypothetical protein